MNKAQLTAQWWQSFLENKGISNVYFVRGRAFSLDDKDIHTTDNIIEKDKTIVIPIDNWISLHKRPILPWDKAKIYKEMEELSKTKMNRTVRLDLEIDGNHIPIESSRVMSPFFDIVINKENISLLRELEVGHVDFGPYKCVSDGYWLFMEPNSLEHGPHEIKTLGSCATEVFRLEMKHYLHIV